jgi:hypothetical protein
LVTLRVGYYHAGIPAAHAIKCTTSAAVVRPGCTNHRCGYQEQADNRNSDFAESISHDQSPGLT